MIKNILRKLAIKYLGLSRPGEGTALSLQVERNTLLQNHNHELTTALAEANGNNQRLIAQMSRMREKYPEVWASGNVAQGCLQLPDLKMAVEFYREDNMLCVVVPIQRAQGIKPRQFVPPFLEIDDELGIIGQPDTMNGKVWIYKIPIKGWNDTIELTSKAKDDHPSYALDGKIQEKTRSFRARCGINGMYRREATVFGNEWDVERETCEVFAHIYFLEQDLPAVPQKVTKQTIQEYLPQGNLEFEPRCEVEFHSYGITPNRIYHWRVPVKEIAVEKAGYAKARLKKGQAALPKGDE